MRPLPVSYLAILGLAVLIHVDRHLARPHDMRLSMDWSYHWLFAVPVFALAAWFLTARFPGRPWAAGAVNILGAAFAAQILEPLAESLGDSRLTLAMPTERWLVFGRFMAVGLLTYLVTATWLERRQSIHRRSP